MPIAMANESIPVFLQIPGLFRMGIKRIFTVNDKIVFLPAETPKFSFNADIVAMTVINHAFHQRNIVGKGNATRRS